ncbi:MAG: hypothetical protein IJY17_01665 [Alphaproteobacteria bacterium]|nr:hypothetical protein [Alphaproteobacteria bacterium]
MKHDHLIDFSELSDSFEQNALRTVEKRDFAAQISAAMAVTGPDHGKDGREDYRSKEEKLAALDQIVKQGTERLDSSQIMALFSAYRDLAAFDKMIYLYKKADNEDFKKAPMVCEQLAVAYRKVPRGKSADGEKTNSERLADKMWDYHFSMDICLKLIDEGYGNGVAYENIGRCLRYIANKTEMADKTAEGKRKKELMTDSVARLESGFMTTLESSVGIQAVHGNIMLGKTDRARETAKVVYLAALRDGAEESNDYFCVSAALQAACIAGEDEKVINHLYNRLENSIRYQWELDDIARDMDRISKSMPSEHVAAVCRRLEGLKESAVPQEDKAGRKTDVIVFKHELNKDRYMTEDPKLQAVRDHSYSYRGCGSAFRGTNRVSGNMAFGGQLPDHTVSRKDLRLFTGLVKMTPAELGIKFDKKIPGADMAQLMLSPLTEIKDPELFMCVADRFIRQTFTTENFAGSNLHMEDNALSKNENGESVYDATVKSVLRACGKKIGDKDKNVDTRTNISAIFALGMGDCRHHAQVKQIMFDMWQKQQMNSCLSDMYYSVWQGNPVETKGPQAQKFFDILDTELRTADIEVRVPVLMEQTEKKKWHSDTEYTVETDEKGNAIMVDKPYSPLMTEDGKYIVDATQNTHNLEDHTLCWLIKKDRDGNLTEFGLRDAFYQEHYGWGRQDVDVSKIEVIDGKPKIPAGKISGGKTSTGEAIEIYQEPTPYNSGKRDTVVSNSIGRDVCLVGVPLNGFATPSDFVKMIKDRDGMADIMQSVLLKDPETKGWTAWREAPKPKVSLQQKVGAHSGPETVAGDMPKKQMSLQGSLNKINDKPAAFHMRLNEGSRS